MSLLDRSSLPSGRLRDDERLVTGLNEQELRSVGCAYVGRVEDIGRVDGPGIEIAGP